MKRRFSQLPKGIGGKKDGLWGRGGPESASRTRAARAMAEWLKFHLNSSLYPVEINDMAL
jgi:hypothetical protein